MVKSFFLVVIFLSLLGGQTNAQDSCQIVGVVWSSALPYDEETVLCTEDRILVSSDKRRDDGGYIYSVEIFSQKIGGTGWNDAYWEMTLTYNGPFQEIGYVGSDLDYYYIGNTESRTDCIAQFSYKVGEIYYIIFVAGMAEEVCNQFENYVVAYAGKVFENTIFEIAGFKFEITG